MIKTTKYTVKLPFCSRKIDQIKTERAILARNYKIYRNRGSIRQPFVSVKQKKRNNTIFTLFRTFLKPLEEGSKKQTLNTIIMENYIVLMQPSRNHEGALMKHHVRDLINYTQFIDREHSEWTWFNVYEKDSREKLASFTKHSKPQTKRL